MVRQLFAGAGKVVDFFYLPNKRASRHKQKLQFVRYASKEEGIKVIRPGTQ